MKVMCTDSFEKFNTWIKCVPELNIKRRQMCVTLYLTKYITGTSYCLECEYLSCCMNLLR